MEEYNESSTGSIIVGGNKNNSSSKGRFLSAEGTSPLIDSVNCQREPEIDLSTASLHQAAATFNNVVMLVLLFLIFGLSNSAFLALSFYCSSFLCICSLIQSCKMHLGFLPVFLLEVFTCQEIYGRVCMVIVFIYRVDDKLLCVT